MTAVCMNPGCKRKFVPGHYGALQRVCNQGAMARCFKCRGSGKLDGRKCFRCKNGKVHQTCRSWYRMYYAKTRKLSRGISDEELKRIVKACEPDLLYKTLIIVAYNSGLRKGELLGLTPSVVLDPDGAIRSSIDVLGQYEDRTKAFKPTKTGEPRVAYLLEPARKALACLFEKIKIKRDERIWPFSEVTAWRRFNQIQKRLGIVNSQTGRPFRFHDHRHSGGVNMYEATGDLKRVQEFLGHASLATSAIYSQQLRSKVAADMDAAMKKRKRT